MPGSIGCQDKFNTEFVVRNESSGFQQSRKHESSGFWMCVLKYIGKCGGEMKEKS